MNTEQSNWYKRLLECGVPKVEARMLATNDIRHTEALAYADEFAKNVVQGIGAPSILILAGPTGVGKTIAACHLVKCRLTDRATGTVLMSGAGINRFRHVSEIAEVGLFGGDDEKKSRAEWKTAGCLVVDDVGAELRTDAFLAGFDALVNARYGNGGITCITTNLPADDFGRRYGERVLDRLRGRGAWYDINHESLRGAAV